MTQIQPVAVVMGYVLLPKAIVCTAVLWALQCNCYLQQNKVLIRFGTKPGVQAHASPLLH